MGTASWAKNISSINVHISIVLTGGGGWAEWNHHTSLPLNKTAWERSGLSHIHTHTLYSRHAFRPRLRPSVSAHHPSNTTQISCNPFPSSAGLYSIRRSLPWGLHHFITLRLMRRDLTSQPPTLDNTRTCQLLTQPWKVPAACGWITRKWAKERGFWAESDQKTSKDPLQTPSVWDHGGGGARVYVRLTCDSSQIHSVGTALGWHLVVAQEGQRPTRETHKRGHPIKSHDRFGGRLFLAVREDHNNSWGKTQHLICICYGFLNTAGFLKIGAWKV